MRKVLLLFLLVLLCPSLVFSEEKRQADSSLDRITIERTEISPNPVGRGDLFTLTVIVDHDSSSDIEFPLKDLPGGFVLWRGPSIRSFLETGKNGESVRKVRISASFKASSSGRQIFPSLAVLAGRRVLTTEPVLLRVGLYKNRKLYMPLEVEWQPAFEDVYAGEAVPVFLTVKNQEIVSLFDRSRVETPRDVFFENAPGLGRISTKTTADITLYDIPAAAYILTSPISGEVRIPAAGVDAGDLTGWSDNLSIRVKPVPGEISESGAIGRFSYTSGIEGSRFSAGEVFRLTSEVSGEGNLNYLNIPQPEAEGCFLLSASEDSDYTQSMNGYSGSKRMEWSFTAEQPGVAEITVPEFRWLDKDSGEIKTAEESIFGINILPASVSKQEEENEAFPFYKAEAGEAQLFPGWNNLYRKLFYYIWMFPAFIFFLLFSVFRTRRIILALAITAIVMVSLYSLGRAFLYSEPAGTDSRAAMDCYNRGIDYYEAGETGSAIHSFRSAVYLDPLESSYRETLEWVEDRQGFVNQVRPSIAMHPDIFFFILIGAVNLLFIILILRNGKSGGFKTVALILTILILVVSAVMMNVSVYSRNQPVGIIYGDSAWLRKIPRQDAEPWLPVTPGTAVKVLDDTGEFRLVETGMGLTGWIGREYILYDRADSYGDG